MNRWIERWHGSGPDRGWSIWEMTTSTHGDRVAYVGEGEHSERLTALIVQKHNDSLAADAPEAPAQAEVPLNPADVRVDVVMQSMGGFSPVSTHGVKLTHTPTGIEVTATEKRSQHANRDDAWRELTRRVNEAPAQAAQSAGEVERGDVVAFEFYNRATGHAIVDYSVNTHVGKLSADKGYEARPLVYAAPRQNVLDGSKPIPLWQAREALDELEAAARGDAPFNHQAAAVVRAALSHKEQECTCLSTGPDYCLRHAS